MGRTADSVGRDGMALRLLSERLTPARPSNLQEIRDFGLILAFSTLLPLSVVAFAAGSPLALAWSLVTLATAAMTLRLTRGHFGLELLPARPVGRLTRSLPTLRSLPSMHADRRVDA
ncbi:MAG: hypothetical protein U0835_22655 [Isosphaeraceae bacterium]